MNSHGVMFHHFHDNEMHIKSQGSISSDELDHLICYYKQFYSILNADEWAYKLANDSLEPQDVCLTFDDALRCQYDIAFPILQKHDLTAFWFIYTAPILGSIEKLEVYRHFRFLKYNDIEDFYQDFFELVTKNANDLGGDILSKMNTFNPHTYAVDCPFYTVNDKIFRNLRDNILVSNQYDLLMNELMKAKKYDILKYKDNLWMNESQIKHLHNNGDIIGLHSHTHPTTLNKFSYEEQYSEYSRNKSILEDITGSTIHAASYPCNSYNNDSLKIMKDLDIDIAFRANMANGYHTKLECKREDHTNIMKEIHNENNSFYK